MNIIIFGAAGFIGTNLILEMLKEENLFLTLVDVQKEYFTNSEILASDKVKIVESNISVDTDFLTLIEGQDIVYHLVSTTVPTTSNQHIAQELEANVVMTAKMLDACVKCKVDKVIFLSSGGTVYGKDLVCPLREEMPTFPVSSYGIQKISIEKLLYLYNYMYGLDYRVIRLSNPYGPFQKPNGVLGAVTTFTYKALKKEDIMVYGDGSVVRDFIYIDDAVRGILNISQGVTEFSTFNLGAGYGTSIKQVLHTIQEVLGVQIKVIYQPGRQVDVPINYLDISRYEKTFGKLHPISLQYGVLKLANFMKKNYLI